MRFDYQERIDNYVQGNMTAAERKAFEQDIKVDDELCDQLEYTRMVKLLVSDHQEKSNMLREWLAEDLAEREVVASASAVKPDRKKWLWMSGAAAILVVGFFAIQPMFMHEVISLSPDEQLRGDGDLFAPQDSVCADSIDNDTVFTFSNEYED